jgi:hypothetical protein
MVVTKEKARLRRPPRISQEAEDFISGAEERTESMPSPEAATVATEQTKGVSRRKPVAKERVTYPWEDPRVREDVAKVYNLRLPEPVHLQLKWLAERSPESMHEIAVKAVEAEVRRRIRKETRPEQGGGQ